MSATALHLDLPELPEAAETLREEVRAFVARERAEGHLPPPEKIGLGFDIGTTKRIAAQGWIGLTWPRRYGGGERTALERYVMNEELLAAALSLGALLVAAIYVLFVREMGRRRSPFATGRSETAPPPVSAGAVPFGAPPAAPPQPPETRISMAQHSTARPQMAWRQMAWQA